MFVIVGRNWQWVNEVTNNQILHNKGRIFCLETSNHIDYLYIIIKILLKIIFIMRIARELVMRRRRSCLDHFEV